VRDEERRVDQEPQPNEQIAGDRLLKTLGIDPNKWTVGDRRIALLAIGIGLTIVIFAVCVYVFGWGWTGLAKRTFWDWLHLLVVPIVLAVGGYLFTRSENRRAQSIADQRAKDAAVQAYFDQMAQLLADNKLPKGEDATYSDVRMLVRARTKDVLWKLDPQRKRNLLQFLHEAGLIVGENNNIIGLSDADLRHAYLKNLDLKDANLAGADMKGANMSEVDLSGAILSGADLSGAQGVTDKQLAKVKSLYDATMPNGQKYEDWLKSKGSGDDGENSGTS